MAKSVDAADLKSANLGFVSSSLTARTTTGVYISWLDSRSDKAKVGGSSPPAPTNKELLWERV